MTELHSSNNGFSNIDWLDRHNMKNTSYSQQQQEPQTQQQQESYSTNTNGNETEVVSNKFQAYYAHQLPPINSISTVNSSVAQLNHEPIHLIDDERKQQQSSSSSSLVWDLPSATTTTDSTVSTSSSSYDQYFNQHPTSSTPSPSISTEKSTSTVSTTTNKKHQIPCTKDIHVEKNTEGKPPYSYATLIKYAIENSKENKLTLSEIYQWVIEHYPYYGTAGSGWKNSIRHNLSLNKIFVRVPRPINEPGKGSYWIVDYRSAELDQQKPRGAATTTSRRNNRSVSDPANAPYHRPEWAGSSATPSTSSFGRRATRDARSLSLDAATLSKNLNSVGLGGSASTYGYGSVHSDNGAGTSGYYGHAYAYGRQFATNHHHHHRHQQQQQQQQQQRSSNTNLALRHSSYMSPPGYNLYMGNIAATHSNYHHHHQQQQQQQQQQQHYHSHLQHSNHHQHTPFKAMAQQQQAMGKGTNDFYGNNTSDHVVTSAATTSTASIPTIGHQVYYSYATGHSLSTSATMLDKSVNPTKLTSNEGSTTMYTAFSSAPSSALSSPCHQQQQPLTSSSVMDDLAATSTPMPDGGSPHSSSIAFNTPQPQLRRLSSCVTNNTTTTTTTPPTTQTPQPILATTSTSSTSSPSAKDMDMSCFYTSPHHDKTASSIPAMKSTPTSDQFNWETVL